MNILEKIIAIKKDKSITWRYGKDKKQVLAEIQAAVDGMIAAKLYLPENYIEQQVGIPLSWSVNNHSEGMSYRQISNYIAYVIKTGRLMKRPYRISNI